MNVDRRDRLNLDEHSSTYMKFGEMVVARHHNLVVPAIINSLQTGTPFVLVGEERHYNLVAGMLDMRNEPWNKKPPLFYAYEIEGGSGSLIREDGIKAMWLGEISTDGYFVALHRLKENVIPASTIYVGYMDITWEMTTGFMDSIEGYPSQGSFDVMAGALQATRLLQVKTSKLIRGLGETRIPYYPHYLPTQLERSFPWMRSHTVAWRLEKGEEPLRRLSHGGFALLALKNDRGETEFKAFRAAGYFDTADSYSGSFQHDGPRARHSFADATFDGLLAIPEAG